MTRRLLCLAVIAVAAVGCGPEVCRDRSVFIPKDTTNGVTCDAGARASVTHDDHGITVVCTCVTPLRESQ